MQNPSPANSVVALDVGEKRIGVAVASLITSLPHPLKTLHHSRTILHDIVTLLQEQRAVAVVLGLPRGLEGQETAQTRTVQSFGHELAQHLAIPMYWQDEAVTSRQAEEELRNRGKAYAKEDIDALAATYILEDFLREHKELI